jgi:hypothetical protein
LADHRKRCHIETQSDDQDSEGKISNLDDSAELVKPDDLAFNIRELRIDITNWEYGWGPESTWEKTFNNHLNDAREAGSKAIDKFFLDCDTHVQEGRDILRDLKFVAQVSCNNTPDEIRDLFLQGYDMMIAVTSEVKFFEVKLDEYAPAVPSTKLTNIRSYSSI